MVTRSRVILVATENEHLRHAVTETLAAQGYEPFLVGTSEPPGDNPAAALVLESDVSSPEVGALLLEATRRQPGLPVVLVQSDADMRGWGAEPEGGFRGYLPAPFAGRALVALLERALRNAPPAAVLVHQADSAVPRQGLAAAALQALVQAMEGRDIHLQGHSQRVADLAAAIATKLGRADWEIGEIGLAGQLHDLGMIAIPEALVGKSGPLTAAEYAEVKRHPVVGHDILSGYPYMERVARFVRGHHERYDGTGYPDGLAGNAIPWGAQVLAAAETFDAMTSPRAFRGPSTFTQALERMHSQAAAFIDPKVMQALARVAGRKGAA